jgi:hypothetical protein
MANTVDRVVIISQGELRAQGTLDELTAELRPSMRLRTPEADRVMALLPAAQLTGRRTAPDTVLIDDVTPEVLGPVLAQHQVVVYELGSEGASLEETFLQLTAGLGFGEVPGGDVAEPWAVPQGADPGYYPPPGAWQQPYEPQSGAPAPYQQAPMQGTQSQTPPPPPPPQGGTS